MRVWAQNRKGQRVWQVEKTWPADAKDVPVEFDPQDAGDYLIHADVISDGKVIASDAANVNAYEASLELRQTLPDFDLLKAIAASGGGSFCRLNRLNETLAKLAEYKAVVRVTRTTYRPLWTNPITFWIFVIALCCEWAIRRKSGLM